MKKFITVVMGLLLALRHLQMLTATNDVTIQLKWVTQSQFAGYYVAQDMGYYEEEGLNVTITPGGPDLAPMTVLASGNADVVLTDAICSSFTRVRPSRRKYSSTI